MVRHPLTSAYLKVERARKHLKELDREVRRFVERDPYRLSVEMDPEAGEPVVRFRQVGDRPIGIPLGLGLMAGDVIHNLRSALDHVVFQLAIAGGDNGDRSQFPIYDDADEFLRDQGRLLKGVVDKERAIIECLQPYHVRAASAWGAAALPSSYRDPLALNVLIGNLGRLDNRDKHRLLLNGEIIVPFKQPTFAGVLKAQGTHPADWYRVKDGAEYFRITSWELRPGFTDADVKVNADHPFTLGFGDPEWGPFGQPNDYWSDRTKCFATKADLAVTADAVEQIVGMFNAYFESSPSASA